MKKILLSLLLTVVFAVPDFSQMDMPMKGHGEGHGPMMEMDHMEIRRKMNTILLLYLKLIQKNQVIMILI